MWISLQFHCPHVIFPIDPHLCPHCSILSFLSLCVMICSLSSHLASSSTCFIVQNGLLPFQSFQMLRSSESLGLRKSVRNIWRQIMCPTWSKKYGKCSMSKWINVCEEYHSPWKVIIFLFYNVFPMRLVTACHCPHVLQHSAMKLSELTAWSTLVLCIKWRNWNKDIRIFFFFRYWDMYYQYTRQSRILGIESQCKHYLFMYKFY